MSKNTRFTHIGGGVVTNSNTPSSTKSSQKNIFKPLIASSLALALDVSVGYAAADSTTWWYADGSTQNGPYAYITYGTQNSDPWSGTLSSGSNSVALNLSGRIKNKTFSLNAKDTTVTIAAGKMIDFQASKLTINFTDSYLKFADQGAGQGEHFLRALDGSSSLVGNFDGGSGSETLDNRIWKNVAFYGGISMVSNYQVRDKLNFKNGANMLGAIHSVATGSYGKADITFTGGGNLIAISNDFYMSNSENIRNRAIYIKLNNNLTGDNTGRELEQTYKFGVENQVEVTDAGNLDSENGTINIAMNSTNANTIVQTVAPNATNGKKIITNMIQGNIYIAGYQTQKSVANIYFYNNGIIDGNIQFASNADLNVYFANEGIIRSDLNLALGGDGSKGNGLVIKKDANTDLVDKLTFDGSITTSTAFSAQAKNLILLGHETNGAMTTNNTLNVSSSGGSLSLTATEQASVNIGKIQNTGGTLTLNMTGTAGHNLSFASNDITVNGGTTKLIFNLADSNTQQIDFVSNNIATTSGTFNLSLTTNNASDTVSFKMGNINNAGSMSFDYSATTAPITFHAGNIANSNTLDFNFGNASIASLDFQAGYISNTKALTFTLPSSGAIDFVTKGIYTTGDYTARANTNIDLGTQASFESGYIASYSNTGATGGQLTTTLKATIKPDKNFILSAIDLAGSSSDLTMLGLGVSSGIASGSGQYAILAGKSNVKTEVDVTFTHGNSNALVLGDIYTFAGTNTLALKDTANTDTRADFIGNINAANATTNLYFENTLWAPENITEIIASMLPYSTSQAQANVIKYIQTYGTGKVVTSGGTANIAVNNTSIDFGSVPAMYQVNSLAGGNINIAMKGASNIGAGVKYNTNTTQAINLIFAATTTGSFNSARSTNIANNQFFDVVYQDGVKLTLQDYNVSSLDGSPTTFLAKARQALGIDGDFNDMTFITKRSVATGTNSNGGHDYTDTISLSGVSVGKISKLSTSSSGTNDTYTFDVTLTKDSIFAGNIDLHGVSKSIAITMEQGSKIFTNNNRLVISKLVLGAGTQHDPETILQNSFEQKNTTIDLATGGNDFANIAKRTTFNLLAIGDTSDTTNQAGMQGQNALFRVYVNPEASTGLLGEQTAEKTGNTGADRVVILSGTGGNHYIQAIYDARTNVSDIAYHGGGSEIEGNIAVATVKSNTGITMKGAQQIQGFDLIGTTLKGVATDVTGNSNGSDKDYTTYFLETVVSTGASPANADTTASALGLNYDLFLANFNSLNKRMGELRNNDHAQGAWGRIFNGMLTTSYGLETQSIYTTIQAGYDYAFGFEGANNYLGVALSYANSISDSKKMLDFDGVQKGIDNAITHGVEVALYNSYVEDSGWFNDTIFKFSYMMSNLDIAGQTTSYDTNNFGIVFSDEFGYRFKLGESQEWYIDPQVELGFGYFNQSNLKQVLGEASLDGIQDAIMTLRARVGANWAYDFKNFTQGKGINASVYLGTYYSYDYINGGDISLTTNLEKNTNLTPLASTGRFELNVGTNIEVQNNTRVYFDFERSFGGTITTEYQVNVGVRYSFGENTGYTPFDPNKKSITPLKVSDENAEESEESQESVETQEATQTTTSEQTSDEAKANSTEKSEAKSEEKAQ